jgi:hypothetical protein
MFLLIISLGFLPFLSAVNITVDDTFWSYEGGWNTVSATSPCLLCTIQLDPAQVYNGTWHDTSCNNCSASVTFAGTSATIYGICVASLPPNTGQLNYSVTINDVNTGFQTFNRCDNYVYNYPLFSFAFLNPHTISKLTIYNLKPGALLLDYLVYDNGVSDGTSTSRGGSTTFWAPTATGGPTIPRTTIHSSKIQFAIIAAVVLLGAIISLSALIGRLKHKKKSAFFSWFLCALQINSH